MQFTIATRLGMTVRQLQSEMSAAEFAWWGYLLEEESVQAGLDEDGLAMRVELARMRLEDAWSTECA